MDASRLIPSMYHRRLVLMLGLVLLALAAISARLAALTLIEGGWRRAQAQTHLVRQRWMPTTRGTIFDRRGRPLARDRASFDLAVGYDVMTGAWAERRGVAQARRINPARWAQLSPEQRDALVEPYARAYRDHVDRMWERIARATGTDRPDLDRRIASVVSRVSGMSTHVKKARRERELEARLARGQAIAIDLAESGRDRGGARIDQPIREERSPHVIAPRIGDEIGFEFMRLVEQQTTIRHFDGSEDRVSLLPGLIVQDSGERQYPYDTITVEIDASTLPGPLRSDGWVSLTVQGVASQLLGWMRPLPTREDIDRRRNALAEDAAFRERSVRAGIDGRRIDLGAYRDLDPVGAAGIEWAQEPSLRGLRGLRTEHLDSGSIDALAPSPGRDLHLSIDVMLQARIQAAMSPDLGLARVQDWHANHSPTMPTGTPINGSAVVIEIDTGQILAAVSTPTISRSTLRDDPAPVLGDGVNRPFLNRAFAAVYPPGSIVKPLVLMAAVNAGQYHVGERIACTGHFFADRPDAYRCWIYKQHPGVTHSMTLGEDPDAVEALMVSCNIFFFTLGYRLGPEGVADAYRMYGLGRPLDLGAGWESSGIIGRPGATITRNEAMLMGIGQGPIAWTPIHAADAYATLARGGVRVRPRLILGRGDAPETQDLGLDSRALAAAMEGLHLSVNDTRGTGCTIGFAPGRRERIFNAPDVDIWGKTGTAQASPILGQPDADGHRPVIRSGDHSWFVILVGPKGDRPRYAIAVLMEYAGSGGRVSGPIANQIIFALQTEGYL